MKRLSMAILISIVLGLLLAFYFKSLDDSSGFFCNTTKRLTKVVSLYNKTKELPEHINSKKQYSLYKLHKDHVVGLDFYEDPRDIEIDDIPTNLNIKHSVHANYSDYSKTEFEKLKPFIQKYFTPKKEIRDLSQKLINKYNIDVDNTCMIYYRGTDHSTETKLTDYNSLLDVINKIKDKPSIFAQSDDTNFLNYITEQYNNVGIFEENTHTTSTNGIHIDSSNLENYNSIKVLLAIMLIMAKCKYLIFGSSGNVAYWTVLYRGNMNNVHQPKYRSSNAFNAIISTFKFKKLR